MFVECHTLAQDARRKDCSLVRGFCFLVEFVGNRLHFNWLSAACSLLIGSVCLGFCSVPQTPLHPKGSGILFKLCMDSEPSAFCETNLGS